MENEGKKIRFRNFGKKYIAEFIGDYFVSQESQGTFIKPVAMFRIWDEYERDVIGCITFTEHLLIDSVWAQPHKKHFPSKYRVEALVNLLNYLPLLPAKLKEIYSSCYEYRFDRDFGVDKTEDRIYKIKANDSFEATFERIIFGDSVTNSKIQNAALEIMYNDWEDHSDTNVLVDLLVSVLPISEVNIIKNLKLLLNEGKIHAVTSPSNPQQLISVGLEPSAIRELEGEIKNDVKYQTVGKIVYGTSIENTTYGPNSPITVNIDEIETAFENFQKELKENANQENKDEISQAVEELKIEVKKNRDPEKAKNLLENLKSSANWLYQKILLNPYVSGILVELMMKTAKP